MVSNQASLWGQVFEVAVQRGVLAYLIHQGWLTETDPALKTWQGVKVDQVLAALGTGLNLRDEYAQTWAKSTCHHLLVLGYGLGWTVARESGIYRSFSLKALWCPLTLPGQPEPQLALAQAFSTAFALPGAPEARLLGRGQPARADFLAWFTEDGRAGVHHHLLCLEFSYNSEVGLADFNAPATHQREISRYAQYQERRGVFSRIRAEVEGDEFLLSANLPDHLSVFSSIDKPLFKLAQASSYLESLVSILRGCHRLDGLCTAKAVAVTANGCESIAARFDPGCPDPRADLMASLGKAYRTLHRTREYVPAELDQEIRLVFRKLVQSLPTQLRSQIQGLLDLRQLDQPLEFRVSEEVTDFYNSMAPLDRHQVIARVAGETWGEDFTGRFVQALGPAPCPPLRQVHRAAVVAALQAAVAGRLNLIALEGNPGIGKTTAVMDFLREDPNGYLFVYFSPRVAINEEVRAKMAADPSRGILTLTTSANLIRSAANYYHQGPAGKRESAVEVAGVEGLNLPASVVAFLTPEQAAALQRPGTSKRQKCSLNERDDALTVERLPGVVRTLALAARDLLGANPALQRVVVTAAIQGYRSLAHTTTIAALSQLFRHRATSPRGQQERQEFARRLPTVIVMVDELAGDSAGAPLTRDLADWLKGQFLDPFDTSPFRVILLLSDASLSNEVALNSYLRAGTYAPDKVLISKRSSPYPFQVTTTHTKVGERRHPLLHILAYSYPAATLQIDYSLRLIPLPLDHQRPALRQAIYNQTDETLSHARTEITQALDQGSTQIIFFAQDRAFLRKLRLELTKEILPPDQVAILDQNTSPQDRHEMLLTERRDLIRVFLITSSGTRGISFPKTDRIIILMPRFQVESSLMELAQLIYRGRGLYRDPATGQEKSGDDVNRRVVILINDYVAVDEQQQVSFLRQWLRLATDLVTLLMMLRATIYTRIKGDAGLRRQRLGFVPVGSIAAQDFFDPMSADVQGFLREARVASYESAGNAGLLQRTITLTETLFSGLQLTGHSPYLHSRSYADPATLQVLTEALTQDEGPLLIYPRRQADPLEIPECISCTGPLWLEDWEDRHVQEQFIFPTWNSSVAEAWKTLAGCLREISTHPQLPLQLQQRAREVHRLVGHWVDGRREHSVIQILENSRMTILLPVDYPRFYPPHSPSFCLENQNSWRESLASVIPYQGLVLPVVARYHSFPWAALRIPRGQGIQDSLKDDQYFMASGELNMLNMVLLEEE